MLRREISHEIWEGGSASNLFGTTLEWKLNRVSAEPGGFKIRGREKRVEGHKELSRCGSSLDQVGPDPPVAEPTFPDVLSKFITCGSLQPPVPSLYLRAPAFHSLSQRTRLTPAKFLTIVHFYLHPRSYPA